MDNKKTGNMLLLLAGVVSAISTGLTIWSLLNCMNSEKREREKARESIWQTQENMEIEKLKEQFLYLFQLYEDWEFESFVDFVEDESDDLKKCAASYFAERLYSYVKKNMKMIYSMDGDDGTGKKPFYMSDELLFCEPACQIWSQQEEEFVENFYLARGIEIWLLENGKFVVVTCIFFEKDGWQLIWRFQDRVIQNVSDIPVPFEDLETGLLQLIQEGENE